MNLLRTLIVIVVGLAVMQSSQLHAQLPINFTTIADTNTPIPGGTGNFNFGGFGLALRSATTFEWPGGGAGLWSNGKCRFTACL